MKKLLIATKNPGKFYEISNFLSDLPLQTLSLLDLGIKEEVIEDGKTYKDNSQKKALFYAKISGLPAVADDGGLEIEALGGAPGVKSRRWLGHEASDEELIEHTKNIVKNLSEDNRRAFFKDVVSLALPNGKVWSEGGEIEGEIRINSKLKSRKGLPFRSLFYLPKLKKFYHENELSEEEQKLYNHRYKAIEKLKPIIRRVILNSFQDLDSKGEKMLK